jgi:heme exporter protein A
MDSTLLQGKHRRPDVFGAWQIPIAIKWDSLPQLSTAHHGVFVRWTLNPCQSTSIVRQSLDVPFSRRAIATGSASTLRVTVHRLAKAYGYFWALKAIDLEAIAGERLALLGPNGAGKTTLLRLLAGLIYPTRGAIHFDDVPLTRTAARQRAAIGLLTPGEHLYDTLTARENLAFFTQLYDVRCKPQAVNGALQAVGLERWGDQFAGSLSSGMKCRLALAKWQLLKPKLLLLDEPYGVLDGAGIDVLEGFLKTQSEQGSIVIVASHHVARVLDVCTRAVILEQGKIIFDEAKREPWDSFARAFRAFMPGGDR